MSTSPLYLTEADVARLVTIKDAIDTNAEAFAAWRDPRTTCRGGGLRCIRARST
jgi:hypothetical protein